MSLPRNLTGIELIKLLTKLGYEPTRQSGSHIRLTTSKNGVHHITVPNHKPVKLGTLSGIIKDVGEHFSMSKDEVWSFLKEK